MCISKQLAKTRETRETRETAGTDTVRLRIVWSPPFLKGGGDQTNVRCPDLNSQEWETHVRVSRNSGNYVRGNVLVSPGSNS